jgi:zinc protease
LALATKAGATLLPIQTVDGKEVYGIKDGKTTYFFDVVTGLKTGTSTLVEAGGRSMTQTSSFSDYKTVGTVKIPFKTILNVGMNIELNTTEVKFNEGVADTDFN